MIKYRKKSEKFDIILNVSNVILNFKKNYNENEFTLLSTVIHLVAQGFLQQFLFYANGLLSLFELIDPLFSKYLLTI